MSTRLRFIFILFYFSSSCCIFQAVRCCNCVVMLLGDRNICSSACFKTSGGWQSLIMVALHVRVTVCVCATFTLVHRHKFMHADFLLCIKYPDYTHLPVSYFSGGKGGEEQGGGRTKRGKRCSATSPLYMNNRVRSVIPPTHPPPPRRQLRWQAGGSNSISAWKQQRVSTQPARGLSFLRGELSLSSHALIFTFHPLPVFFFILFLFFSVFFSHFSFRTCCTCGIITAGSGC